MALETMHDRGFYEAKAGEHELLKEVIAGEETLTGSLDDILSTIQKGIDLDNGIERFGEYLGVLGKLSCGAVQEELTASSEALLEYRRWRDGGDISEQHSKKGMRFAIRSSIALFAGMIISSVGGPLAALGYVIASSGALGLGLTPYGDISYYRNLREKSDSFDETLGFVYDAAEELDHEIAALFALEHFMEAPEHFEQMYPLLNDGQRKQVNTQLYAFLGAGGMKGIDELQLDDYLSGLSEPPLSS